MGADSEERYMRTKIELIMDRLRVRIKQPLVVDTRGFT